MAHQSSNSEHTEVTDRILEVIDQQPSNRYAVALRLTAWHQSEVDRLVQAVIGENTLVPKRESWLDGAADKPTSYRNNYEVVRFAEIQNELKAEQRQRYEALKRGGNDE